MFVRINQALDASRARREEGEKGFTLIELLVVVLIIGVLSAIAIPIFLNQQKGAKISAVEADLSSAKTALVATLVDPPTGFTFPATIGATTLTGFAPSAKVTLTISGDATGFCITGKHTEIATTDTAATRYVSDKGGVTKVAC